MSCESDLVKAAQKGDHQAFEELIRAHQEKVFALALRMTRNHHDAEDIAQQTFIKAFRKLGRFRGGSSLFTWLYRIAVNECLSQTRKKRPIAVPDEDLMHWVGGAEGRDAEHMDGQILSKHLRVGVDSLPARQKLAFILRHEEGLSCAETSERMGCREGTAKALCHQAICRLRRVLAPHLEGSDVSQ